MTVRCIQFSNAPVSGLVSVVIPTHNRADLIGRAITSVLAQTYGSHEIIVVDDGSVDETPDVVASFGDAVRYLRQSQSGVSAARNFGFQNARGEYVALLDSDDAWLPWKLEAEVNVLRRNGSANLVWTDMTAIDVSGDILYDRYLRRMYSAYKHVHLRDVMAQVDTLGAVTRAADPVISEAAVHVGDLFAMIMFGNLLHTSTVLLRRALLERAGGYDETLIAGEDYEFHIRLCSEGPVAFIDAPSTLYRVGAADSLSYGPLLLEVARNDLRALDTWLPRGAARVAVPRNVLRRRIGESHRWIGRAEFDAGNKGAAARHLLLSFTKLPTPDRRLLLLAGCLLPDRALDALRRARNRLFSARA